MTNPNIALMARRASEVLKARIPEGDRWHQPWTPTERAALEGYFEKGYSDKVIAKWMRRTEYAIQKQRRAAGLSADGRNLQSVAGLLSVSLDTVRLLIQAGVLRARKTGSIKPRRTRDRGGRHWIIGDADLDAFVRDPLHWHVWHPNTDDLAVREWLTEARGVPMLTIQEAMRRYPGVMTDGGWLQAIRRRGIPVCRDYVNRYLFTEEEAALMAATKRDVRPWTPIEDRRLQALRRRQATYEQIATALGRTVFAVKRRIVIVNKRGACTTDRAA